MINENKVRATIAKFTLVENNLMYGLTSSIAYLNEEILMKIATEITSSQEQVNILKKISSAVSKIVFFENMTKNKKCKLTQRGLKDFEFIYKTWADCCLYIYKNFDDLKLQIIKETTKKEEWLGFTEEVFKDYENQINSLNSIGKIDMPEGELERINNVMQLTIHLIIGPEGYTVFRQEASDMLDKIRLIQLDFISFVPRSKKTIN